MNALMGDMERLAQQHFQIVIRLQQVRARVYDWSLHGTAWRPGNIEIEEILSGIQAVAIAARESGFSGFTSVCLHVCERIEPYLLSGCMPRTMLGLVGEWAANSELYLRRPHFAEFSRALVLQLNDASWGAKLDRAEQNRLMRAMLDYSS